MIKKIKSTLFNLTALVFVAYGGNQDTSVISSDSILMSKKYLIPIAWHDNTNKNKVLYESIISGKTTHPLQIGTLAISYFQKSLIDNDNSALEKGKKLLHLLSVYPHKKETNISITYRYGFDWGNGKFKAREWWSGMANSSVALAYLYGYKITGKPYYKDMAIKSINGTILPIKENGSAIILDENSHWYLEYADKSSDINNSYFVLNGFTFTLAVIKIFEEVLKDEVYEKAYQRGINAFKKFSLDYYYPNRSWVYYMLNPKTIEEVHYARYDMQLIYSLSLYDEKNKEFLQNELEKRKNIFTKHYGIEKYEDGTLIFSAIGIPHPYSFDIFPTNLKFYLNDGQSKIVKIAPRNSDSNISERAFVYIDKNESKDIKSIDMITVYKNGSSKLNNIDIKNLESIKYEKDPNNILTSTKNVYEDLYMNENDIYLKLHKDKTSRGFIQYSLKEPINLWSLKYFFIFIDSAIEISNIRILLLNDKGEGADRYYIPQKVGKSLILLSALGFNNQNIDHSITKVRFYIYAKGNQIDKNASLSFSDLQYINNNRNLYDLFKKNEINHNSLFNFENN